MINWIVYHSNKNNKQLLIIISTKSSRLEWEILFLIQSSNLIKL